jgi:Tol biopolymer transport system component
VESDPFLTADGKKLFFVRDIGIWYSDWSDTGWTNAQIIGPQINVGGWFKQSPSVSPDGQKLYYVDAARDGYYWDIWVSTWDSSQSDWNTPVNLGWPVNTAGVEYSAHLAPDGMHLYFYSQTDEPDSLNPNGRCGLYVSEWNGSNWSIPMEVAPSLLTCSNGSQYPSVTADSQWLYFDQYVSDGKSIFVSQWADSGWQTATDLRTQIGGRAGTPFISPSGETLFFAGSTDLGGYGSRDIWLIKRLILGDLNMDNQITAADAVLQINWVFLGESFPAPPQMGDLNCDGSFTQADVVLLLNRAFLGRPFPCSI